MPRVIPPDNLACPIDRQPLERVQGSYRCADGHSFDIARQGYVNLLLVQQKKSRAPGDSREMVEARRDFLDSGHYAPVAEAISGLVSEAIADRKRISLLDAGCGEGYYTDYLARLLEREWQGEAFSVTGVDISKPAVMAATRRNRDICWIVGTNRNLPVTESSVDLVLSLFGYPQFDHFHALLKPGGTLLLADAGPRHLIELRECLYEEVRSTPEPSIRKAIDAGFVQAREQRLDFKTEPLLQHDLLNLARMTPHYYRAPRERREQLQKTGPLACSIDILFRGLVRD
jgi:23S rRNA (guanine745-N1)-methyltransferase